MIMVDGRKLTALTVSNTSSSFAIMLITWETTNSRYKGNDKWEDLGPDGWKDWINDWIHIHNLPVGQQWGELWKQPLDDRGYVAHERVIPRASSSRAPDQDFSSCPGTAERIKMVSCFAVLLWRRAPDGSEFSHRVWISFFLLYSLAPSLRRFTESHWINKIGDHTMDKILSIGFNFTWVTLFLAGRLPLLEGAETYKVRGGWGLILSSLPCWRHPSLPKPPARPSPSPSMNSHAQLITWD